MQMQVRADPPPVSSCNEAYEVLSGVNCSECRLAQHPHCIPRARHSWAALDGKERVLLTLLKGRQQRRLAVQDAQFSPASFGPNGSTRFNVRQFHA